MIATVLIADDHWAIRQTLSDVVSRCPELRLLAQADDGVQALALAKELQPDVLVLDISLPQLRGMQVLRQLRAAGSKVKILIFTMYPADQYADIARHWGAQGFLSKDADGPTIVAAIQSVARGETVFPATLPSVSNAPAAATPRRTLDTLSQREAEVFKALVQAARRAE